jgi:hypothetical protein
MMRIALVTLMLAGTGMGWWLAMPTNARAEITIEPSERGAAVKFDGQLFAEYLTRAGHQPAVWPIFGPTGKEMTRSYPVGPRVEGETTDHPHHVSLWFTHGAVNGLDFWTSTSFDRDPERGNQIVHREFVAREVSGGRARIVTRNDWLAGNRRICEDERTLQFAVSTGGQQRWIDFTVKLTASEGELVLGDTKEGTFGVRIADPLRVTARPPGRIVNSRGQVNNDAWGMPAEWVDNSGQLNGQTVGIAIMSHPASFRAACRWHARDYGLLAANPFGEREFLAEARRPRPAEPLQGAHTLPRGESLTFRYRVLLHTGDAEAARVAESYRAFAAAQ